MRNDRDARLLLPPLSNIGADHAGHLHPDVAYGEDILITRHPVRRPASRWSAQGAAQVSCNVERRQSQRGQCAISTRLRAVRVLPGMQSAFVKIAWPSKRASFSSISRPGETGVSSAARA